MFRLMFWLQNTSAKNIVRFYGALGKEVNLRFLYLLNHGLFGCSTLKNRSLWLMHLSNPQTEVVLLYNMGLILIFDIVFYKLLW
ncbi:hypothetical protein L1987_61445 [Smallanthus sonchifolius]|uniref:Uncharacterized protein n=1 Tax=Smallanthus sonchifolius TaxID=185202 RepID=A0ACB9C7L0_9ASTR|nr:hypothetical protein L1987_61445 [Smallanthus sonchifolius]